MVLDQVLYQIAFEALAKMELPDFSKYNQNEIFFAFRKLYGYASFYSQGSDSCPGGKVNPENSRYLCDEVAKASSGKVTLEPASFWTGIKGSSAQYYLKSEKETKKVAFGPYFPPFTFVK